MSYQNYLQSLKFGSVSESIGSLQAKEMSKIDNQFDMKELGLQDQISKLSSGESATNAVYGSIDSGVSTLGGVMESATMMKKIYGLAKDRVQSTLQGAKQQIGDKVSEMKDNVEGKVSDLRDNVSTRINRQVDPSPEEVNQPNEIEMTEMNTDYSNEIDAVGGTNDDVGNMDDFDQYEPEPSSFNPDTEAELDDIHEEGDEEEGEEEENEMDGGNEEGFAGRNDRVEDPEDDEVLGRNSFQENTDSSTGNGSGNLLESPEATTQAATEGATEGATDAAEGATEAVAEAGTVGAEAGLDAAGAALEATSGFDFGIGAVIGGIMQLAGLGVGVAEGVKDATTSSQEQSDETAESNLKTQAANLKSQVSSQTFAGANVMPSLTSTTAGSITSGAF